MYNPPPQWPDRPAQTPGGGPPRSNNRVLLGLVAVVAAVLIVALIGTLIVLLSRNGQDGIAGQEQNAAAATAAAQGVSTNGQPLADSGTPSPASTTVAPTATPAPTNTTASAPATPTATTHVICCLTILLPSIHQVVASRTLSGTDVGPVGVSCPTGEVALSGGWATNARSDLDVYNSSRNGTGGWQVYVSHSSPIGVNSYAECLSNASGASIVQRTGQVTLAPGNTGSAAASCSAGETLVGGGYAYNTGLELYNFSPNSSTQWIGYAKNHGGSSGILIVYAQCLTYSGSHTSTSVHQVSIASGATGGSTSNACPSGTAISGGGYADDDDAFVYSMFANGSSSAWNAYLFANGGRSELLNSYAVCLGF